jgi:hypothetical protein
LTHAAGRYLPNPEDFLTIASDRILQEVFSGAVGGTDSKLNRMRSFSPAHISLLLVTLAPFAFASDKKNKDQDHFDIVSHLPDSDGPATRFTVTRHVNRSYLYVEHASHALRLFDVTDATHPKDLGLSASGTVFAAAGDAALISSDNDGIATPKEKSLTIVSFADPAHPQAIRQFNKVTCTAVDEARGLVFIANDEGLWILHRNPADDRELQERYAHDVLYNH